MEKDKKNPFGNLIEVFGRGAGKVTSTFYAAGRETMDVIIHNVLPFMFFVSALVGIITSTGIGDIIANALSPLANNIVGLIILSFICGFPILSPLLGPGAVIAQVLGVLIGTEIGRGNIPPQFALPALFAIDVQVGADFIPVGMSLGEARPETTECAVPAILLGRFITAPVGVLIGFAVSFSLF
ncbi:nucleoside recognition domain-containing protein [Enterococcus avium]|uniref:nucleoside recognition domain-containing protein n=1 Tax=Enterococcus avium TaxID=33945 RepID=UPI003D80FFB0